MSFWKRTRRSRGRKSGRKTKSRSKSTGSPLLTWALIGAVVVLCAGIGVVKWAETGPGQAALLSLGSERMFGDVQQAVDEVLAATLPGFGAGPVAAGADARPLDHDWLPDGSDEAVRCRTVAVDGAETWWEVQRRVDRALAAVGAHVLWAERLVTARRPGSDPDEESDALRLDVGVTGRPTHTLVLHRRGVEPHVRWGLADATALWKRLAAQEGPVVALVIDDWGNHNNDSAQRLGRLPVPMTMAVLPGLPYSRHFANEATDLVLPGEDAGAAARPQDRAAAALRRAAGCPVPVSWQRPDRRLEQRRREVLLHMPMEPLSYPGTDPGPQALMVGMDRAEIAAKLDGALGSFKRVTGVNNHMGSAATSDQATMDAFMAELASRELIFIDSLTTPTSVAYATAREAGVPSARNRIFLDADNESHAAIARNLEALVAAARSRGYALGIGHPHPATADVLAREIPRLRREGVRFVTVSEFIALQAAEATGG